MEAADEEFSLNMLLPYVRHQGRLSACYSYSTGEAVQALHASIYSVDPFELSTQQIVDHVPLMFDYESHGKRKDDLGCYYSNHPAVLHYIWLVGLVKDNQYLKRENRRDEDVLPIPNVTRYSICGYRCIFQSGTSLNLRKDYESEMTREEINEILRQQPMVGSTRACQSLKDFRGEGVYMGPDADELAALQAAADPRIILHSMLIVGYGVINGMEYYKIKNSYGIGWGHQGFGKIRRDLVIRLAYPIGPAKIEVEQEKVASVTVTKNTRLHRIKRHEGRPKTPKGRMQFGAQGKRSGTSITKKQPTQDDINDISEANKRCKTNAVGDKKKEKKEKKKKSQQDGKAEVEQDKPSLVVSFVPGLVIEELSKGMPGGRKAYVGFKVGICFTGKLKENDKIFDTNIGKGEPLEFRIASGELIKGWEIGVVGMCVGDKRRITIPPALGYGAKGYLDVVPPDSWLVIEVELIYVRSNFAES